MITAKQLAILPLPILRATLRLRARMMITAKLTVFTLQSRCILRRLLTNRLCTLPAIIPIRANRPNMREASLHTPRVAPRIIQHLATTLQVLLRATPPVIPPPAINLRVIHPITRLPATIPRVILPVIQHPAMAMPIQARPP